MSDVTHILDAIGQGDSEAYDKLLTLVYDELRKLAADKMARENPGQILQPTALVHEAWLRLNGNRNVKWDGRAHFFGAAAEAMRSILIDYARRKKAARHGAGLERVELDEVDAAVKADDTSLLRINDALEMLAREDPACAQSGLFLLQIPHG